MTLGQHVRTCGMVLRALIAERVADGQGRVCRSWIGIDQVVVPDLIRDDGNYCVSVEVRSIRQFSCCSLAPGTSFTRRRTMVPRLEGRPSPKSTTIGAS